ncbi:chlorhexidine efflux transporter [Vibrio agarivorans]
MKTHTTDSPIHHFKQQLVQALLLEAGILFVISPTFIDEPSDINLFGGKVIILLIAMIIWNAAYRFGFDYYLWNNKKTLNKTLSYRLIYTVLFQVGVLVISTPIMFSIFDSSFWHVVTADLWFSLLVFSYSYITNFIYDRCL